MLQTVERSKNAQAYKQMNDIHFELFFVESGSELEKTAQEIFKKICNLITKAKWVLNSVFLEIKAKTHSINKNAFLMLFYYKNNNKYSQIKRKTQIRHYWLYKKITIVYSLSNHRD